MSKDLSHKVVNGIKIAGEFFPLYGLYQLGKNAASGLISKEGNPIRYKTVATLQTSIALSIIYIPFVWMVADAIRRSNN